MPYSLSRAHKKIIRNIAFPIMGIVGLMICFVIALAVFLAQQQTRDEIKREQDLARGMIDIRLSELTKIVNDYAFWDDAVSNLAKKTNFEWAETNVGPTMKERYGVDAVFVLDPDGRTTYGMTNESRTRLPAEQIMTSGFDRILSERATRGPAATASGIALADGRPALVAVSPIRPYSGLVDETRDRRTILAFVDLLDDAELHRLSKVYRLPDLHIEEGGAPATASVVVTTSDGRVPVRLAWTGDDPGKRLLGKLLPFLLALLAAFVILILFVFRQMSVLLRNLRQTEERASHDPLTGLLNRSVLMRKLEAMTDIKGQVTPHTLLYLDLDGFKAVNDRFGHEVGDMVLRTASRHIKAAVPDSASVYRLGGDEFAVLIAEDLDVSIIRSIGARIIGAISLPMTVADQSVKVGATIGVSIAPKDGKAPLDLIRHADQALYMGKREGKGSIRCYIGVPDKVARQKAH
ncbi:sensor domain-containing diguanylate cyclase [Aureimonas ureilytica]|uniref:sensor domain-containing diguanylate cyclase n=1 Tax=Aureimonas ureilytica TaxID=401562 RepID=UPI00037AEB1C|nr:diguanylate cyclase [Aureimonas ureilytica]